MQQAPPGTGLVAATAQEGGSPVWIVTGLDAAGVNAAAGALDPATLRDAFAVAVEPSGLVAPAGGRRRVSRLAMAYRPRASALHAARAGASSGFCLALGLVALLYDNPIVLGGTLAAVLAVGVAAGVGRELRRAALLALGLALLVAAINPLVSSEGLTVLVRGGTFLGRRWDITLEAVAYGAVAALRVVVLVLACALFSAVVDPDELLRLLRRISYRSALTAALATRLVPVLARDGARMGEAARCRPNPPGRAAVIRSALAGSLERSVDLAAALEVRGYGGARAARPGAAAVVAPRPARGGERRRHRGAGAVGQARGGRVLHALSARPRSRPGRPSSRWWRASWRWRSRRSRGPAAGWGWRVPEPILIAESFSYSYPESARPALDGVSLELAPGSFTVLAGESGSGKSTLLRAACGIVPHFHGGEASGELSVAGMSVRDHGPERAVPRRAARSSRTPSRRW